MNLRLHDIPEIPPHRFTASNSVLALHVGTPCYRDTATGRIKVDDDFAIIGWCEVDKLAGLASNREGQIAIMLWSGRDGIEEAWQHYPLFDRDERDATIFECKRGLV